MALELTPEETQLLLEILQDRLGELREQIHHSATSTFTDQLKEREEKLKELIARLQSEENAS